MRSLPLRRVATMTAFCAIAACASLPEEYPLPPDRSLLQRPDSTVSHGVVLASGDTAYWDYQVTQPATPLKTIVPDYTEGTRSREAEGKVVARFAVNDAGLPVMSTFTIVSSPDYALSAAVHDAVAKSRFRPADLHGRPVAQVVEMPFNFSIVK
ncbi:MAG: TonB family protein [Gemmatimonadaceae bacterium]|nr:TonB family protein [Gemmatimonadaceae bacterium]NUQ91344.1 TonB family protein [Gemmatimonadaceae bacterium]NUR20761.1 TonB family protein [Gemmatimonadaceae bacterium]NUS97352.1 TonB family protein [Gemmatimonadaceae bacterium]